VAEIMSVASFPVAFRRQAFNLVKVKAAGAKNLAIVLVKVPWAVYRHATFF
jgi:hypothetical protein